MQPKELEDLTASVGAASHLLKAISNPNRLLILCHLVEGEKSVGELEALIKLRQPSLSQQLARLRRDGLVDTRRDSKRIYYSISSDPVRPVLNLLHEQFCANNGTVELPVAQAAE